MPRIHGRVRLEKGDEDGLKFQQLRREALDAQREERRRVKQVEAKEREKRKAKEALAEDLDPWVIALVCICAFFVLTCVNSGDMVAAIIIAAANALLIFTSMARKWTDIVTSILLNFLLVLLSPHFQSLHRLPAVIPWSSWLIALPFNALIGPPLYVALTGNKTDDDVETWRSVWLLVILAANGVVLPLAGVLHADTVLQPLFRLATGITKIL
eukprot:TRINITY_DN48181_c0_g1_i1.p1 TRINITY_DN48181_c0_g1~~TRINITY_DN48181_c0_g1_i1.p1  ORF type:complete len:213 (+),score=46.54 TRINITY_DN48181_c0_g1_i1:137-775(+)